MEIQYIGMAAALGLSAIGSGFGAGAACLSSVGAWKKCYASGKPAPFIMVAFSGAPLTQTIYGFLLMNFIRSAVEAGASGMLALMVGLLGGLSIGLSAYFQGRVAASAINVVAKKPDDWSKGMVLCITVEFYAILSLLASMLMILNIG